MVVFTDTRFNKIVFVFRLLLLVEPIEYLLYVSTVLGLY